MSPRVADLLAELAQRGITLRPAGALLGVSPRSALTPDLLARVRELKAEILSALTAPAHEPVARAGDASPAERRVLFALSHRPGLSLEQLVTVTRIQAEALQRTVAVLSQRGEVAPDDACLYKLVVN